MIDTTGAIIISTTLVFLALCYAIVRLLWWVGTKIGEARERFGKIEMYGWGHKTMLDGMKSEIANLRVQLTYVAKETNVDITNLTADSVGGIQTGDNGSQNIEQDNGHKDE